MGIRPSKVAEETGARLIPGTAILIVLLAAAGSAVGGPVEPPAAGPAREASMPWEVTPGADVYWPVGGLPTSPPENPQVGDSWLWWLWVHDPMPPHFEQAMCTVRGMSDRGYVIVRDDEWLVSVDQADVDQILERWENSSVGPWPDKGIYELDSLAFGAPPDRIDMDPRIYLVWFDFGIAADGFFFFFDEYPEGTYPEYHSNECEALYLNPYSTGGPSGNYMLAVAAHEFEHMIHWNWDENETSWVTEGFAELAMWLYGAPDNITGFSSNPDNCLTEWTGVWADYIKTYLWSLYFYERYGGLPAVYDVVHDPANSIEGFENVLDDLGYTQDFADVFADWAVANYLDDPSVEDGRFGYVGDDLPAFGVSGTYSTYPVGPVSKTVNHWATDYYRFQSLDSYGSLLLTFDGDDSNSFAVWALALHQDGATQVHRMPVDGATQTGALYISGLTDPGDQVVLVAASISSTGGTGYSFSAVASQGVESDPGGEGGGIVLRTSPNPFSSIVTLELGWSGSVQPAIGVYDIHGRLVRTLGLDAAAAGEAVLTWDGCDASGRPAPSGAYLVRAVQGSMSGSAEVLLLR
jgi:hypothetical protein